MVAHSCQVLGFGFWVWGSGFALFPTEIGFLDAFFGCPRAPWGGSQKRPRRASLTLFFNFCRRRVVVFFKRASATPKDPHKSAHHEHQRVGSPRVSDAAESLENADNTGKYRGFRAVTDVSVLRPACAPISHACLEAGAAYAHDAPPGGVQGCASSRLRCSLGMRGASISSISGS